MTSYLFLSYKASCILIIFYNPHRVNHGLSNRGAAGRWILSTCRPFALFTRKLERRSEKENEKRGQKYPQIPGTSKSMSSWSSRAAVLNFKHTRGTQLHLHRAPWERKSHQLHCASLRFDPHPSSFSTAHAFRSSSRSVHALCPLNNPTVKQPTRYETLKSLPDILQPNELKRFF